MQLAWTTERRKVNDMLPYVHNPRKMSVSQMKALQDSLNQFGLVEIPVINTDGTLIAGHQRCKGLQMLGKGDELIDVRVPNRELTEKELKQYNVASNAIKGDWLEDVLKEHFGDVDLDLYGLDLDKLHLQIKFDEKYEKLDLQAEEDEYMPDELPKIDIIEGDLVYDPFLGSGTTMVAAEQLNRICYGFELDPIHCQMIINRMKILKKDIQIKLNGKLITD